MKKDIELNEIELIKDVQDNTSDKNVSLDELMKNNYQLGVSTVETTVDEYWESILEEIFINRSSIICALVPVAASSMLRSIKTYDTGIENANDFQKYAVDNIKKDIKKYIKKLRNNQKTTIPGSYFNLGDYRVSWAIDNTKTRIAIILDSSMSIDDFRQEFGLYNKALSHNNGAQLLLEFDESGDS